MSVCLCVFVCVSPCDCRTSQWASVCACAFLSACTCIYVCVKVCLCLL